MNVRPVTLAQERIRQLPPLTARRTPPHNFLGSSTMEKTDPASSEDVKRMVQDLGSTIQRTLAESPQIAHCLNRIKAEGYEVSLVLEATIGFSKSGSRESRGLHLRLQGRQERARPRSR